MRLIPTSAKTSLGSLLGSGLALACLMFAGFAHAGAQVYEELSAQVRNSLQKAVSDRATSQTAFSNNNEAWLWLSEMSTRLAKRYPDSQERIDLLRTVHYEAKRAGLDPQLVLGVIEVESAFRKYAVSTAGAQGYMQVMPFWMKTIGTREHNLFHLRTNLRYGCTILRHYLDIEKGNVFRALGRYNGSLGRPEYPNLVLAAWTRKWNFQPKTVAGTIEIAPSIIKTSNQ